jgi:salicylate hydroxylase
MDMSCTTPYDAARSRATQTISIAYERVRVPRARAAVLGSRERACENHLASPWARLKRDVKFALRERFGRDKTVFQSAWLYGYDVGRELR